MNIKNIFLSEEDRYELTKNRKFSLTNKYWNMGKFNYYQNIGGLSSIIQKANEEWKKEGKKGVMTKIYFVNYYLYTGEKRIEKLKKGDTSVLEDKDYGRTMPELYTISKQFKDYTNQNSNLHLNDLEAFNYLILRVFDKTYEGFLREENTLQTINTILGDRYHFRASNNYEDVFYSVDYIGYNKKGKISIAIQIKPINYMKDKNGGVYRDINKKKHSNFKEKYGVEPIILYSDIGGYIYNVEILNMFV